MYKAVALSILIASPIAQGRLNQLSSDRKLAPEEVGAYHTEAFDLLGKKYSEEKPEHIFNVVKDLSEILASFCPDDNSECKVKALESTRDEFKFARKNASLEITYPESFDKRLEGSISEMFSHVEAIDEHNLDEVLQSLKNIKDEIENMIKVDELHKHVGLVGISVAMESSKLWHSTKYDNMHPLHEMINYFDPETGNRRLQINFLPFKVEFDTAAVVLADVRAAVFNALNSFGGTGGEGGVGSSLTDVVFKATAASAASFANTVSLEQKEDDDDYTYYAPTGNIEPQQPNDNTQQPQQPNDNTQQPQQPNDGDSPSDDIFKEFDDFICGLIGCDPTDEVNEEP